MHPHLLERCTVARLKRLALESQAMRQGFRAPSQRLMLTSRAAQLGKLREQIVQG